MPGTLIVVLSILWLPGFAVVHVGGLVHILLVVPLAVPIYQLLPGRSAL